MDYKMLCMVGRLLVIADKNAMSSPNLVVYHSYFND